MSYKNMIEIERKFLFNHKFIDGLYKFVNGVVVIEQAYLNKSDKGSVRLRIETTVVKNSDEPYALLPQDFESLGIDFKPEVTTKAYLMSKTKLGHMSNQETVDEITVENAKFIIFAGHVINKIKKSRIIKYYAGRKWEIDVFDNGLILVEVEIDNPDEVLDIPEWVGEEVTGQLQYYNQNM